MVGWFNELLMQEYGSRGISHPPETGGRLRASPQQTGRCYSKSSSGPGGRWGSMVFGWRAPRPPRVVFVLINSLTSGKKV